MAGFEKIVLKIQTLQLLGDFVHQTPRFAPGPYWGTSVPQTHSLGIPLTALHHKYHPGVDK